MKYAQHMFSIFRWSVISAIIALFALFQISVPTIYIPPAVHKLPIKLNVYVDKSMNLWEMDQIEDAALKWRVATNNKVQFTVRQLPVANLSATNSIIILKVNEDFPKILFVDRVNGGTTLGLYDDAEYIPSIYLVVDRLNENDYSQVVMHELGHSIGMAHITASQGGVNTLMFPTVNRGANFITKTDLSFFCKLYLCDPKTL